MKIYAIQNIETKLFLEAGKSMARTRAKFGSKPRLFNTKHAASNALSCWILGNWGSDEGYPVPPVNISKDRAEIAPYLKIVEAEVEFKNA